MQARPVKRDIVLRRLLALGSLFVGVLAVLAVVGSNNAPLLNELSESAALAMASQYFGVMPKQSSHSGIQSKTTHAHFALDPVSPFFNTPDPDAPSMAEIKMNYKRTQLAKIQDGESEHDYSQLALHSFFVPSPSPMFEASPEELKAASQFRSDTALKKIVHQQALAKVAKRQGPAEHPSIIHTSQVARNVIDSHSPTRVALTSTSPKGIDLDEANGIFSNIFKDSKVRMSSAHRDATLPVRQLSATSSHAPNRSGRRSSAQQAFTTPPTPPSLVTARPAEAIHLAAVAALHKTSPLDSKGVFGDPFDDSMVAASDARAPAASLFS